MTLKNDPNHIVRGDFVKALSEADPKYIDKLEKHAETFLQEQLKTALASSQRAITLAAVFAAVLASIMGGTASLIAAEVNIWPHIISALILVPPLFIALCFSIHAARPTGFSYAGSNPKFWLSDIKARKKFEVAQSEQIALYSENITENTASLDRSARNIHAGLKWMVGGLLASGCVEFIIVCSLIAKNGLTAVLG